ncbi:MAG: fibronectin type III domain-containing protein [Acidobacteria bacterium]|nr:fibronectin type III domain-containing protein [Acidobacteriota bacterium]
MFVLLAGSPARAATVTIAWDQNSESDLAGYVVQYGTAAGKYSQTIDVGNKTSWTLPNAEVGRTYYFTVQAYNVNGQRSAMAKEVTAAIPGSPIASGPVAPPFGVMDTPLDNVTGVTGSLAVTGWALAQAGGATVRIYRDPVAGEPHALILIGDAVFIEGARPDVATAYPGLPGNTKAGWGHLLLTNMLPNRGTGTYRLHAIATDAHNVQTLLGSRTITCANSSAIRPFGAIDTPPQGGTVYGSVYNNFGWVLSPGKRRADPTGGGSVTVLIDGVPAGEPGGWTNRSDLTTVFGTADYAGIGKAAGVFTFDTTKLSNGLHTIAWAVHDNQLPPASDGIGSRYFMVSNGGGATRMVAASTSATSTAPSLDLNTQIVSAPREYQPLLARRGFNLETPFRRITPATDGRITVQGEELDRFELRTEGQAWTAGYMRFGDSTLPLPIGSRLDAGTGAFTWQPGVGFVGTYDFVFVRWSGGTAVTAQDVRIVLNPKASGRVGPQVVIDVPAAGTASPDDILVAGWAIDRDAETGTGISTLHVWAYPADGSAPVFVGAASTGGRRPDVAAIHGDQFRDAGYGLVVRGLPHGDYRLAVFAWSTVTGGWVPARTVAVTVR